MLRKAGATMYVEQQLTVCEVCREHLAVQFEWAADRPPSANRDRVSVRWALCPTCRHLNPLLLPLYAYAVDVKVVPGPMRTQGVQPNTLRRFWLGLHETAAPPRSSAIDVRIWSAVLRLHQYLQLLAWWLSGLKWI